MGYHKTTVEIDAGELRQAKETLGTRGIKETVNAALHEVNRRVALKDAVSYVLSGDFRVPEEEPWASWREPRD